MKIEIVEARDDAAVVSNLFELYAHDMSEFVGLDVDDAGRFAIPASIASYWDAAEVSRRHPFVVRADGKLAGFALVRQIAQDPPTHDMGEFFVLRKYRRTGLGRRVACDLFDRFPGRWEVRELPANVAAQRFWRRTIEDYTRGAFTETQEFFAEASREFVVQRFRSEPDRPPSPVA